MLPDEATTNVIAHDAMGWLNVNCRLPMHVGRGEGGWEPQIQLYAVMHPMGYSGIHPR